MLILLFLLDWIDVLYKKRNAGQTLNVKNALFLKRELHFFKYDSGVKLT